MKKTEAIKVVEKLVDIAWDIAIAERNQLSEDEIEGHITRLKRVAAEALGVIDLV